jgi:uncharacterized protein YndB with AHSA1/START domain
MAFFIKGVKKMRGLVRKMLVVGLLAPLAVGCDSLAGLNRLAAAGSIHEDAAVKTHLQMQIAAPPAKVWALLIDAPSWPKWQKNIESVSVKEPLAEGTQFSWRTGGTDVHSQVQLFEPEHRVAWTGTAMMIAKAVHVWELQPTADGQTLVTMKESMDGPLMAQMYSSEKLSEAGRAWLAALKEAAENP